MPLFITHLRRWFAAATIAVILTVAGVYFYSRHRVQNALKQVPEKIGIEIKQSATGFSISKSEQGRTFFKIEASKAVQFKQGGRAELHDVAITLYGRDSSRYDQIYGADFEYDPQSGDVTANGVVQIDLEANPEGILNPDQATPKELKNPIHLKTSGLVFNQKTGNAYTKQAVEFRLPQASGSAVGVTYVSRTNVLTLESEVRISGAGDNGVSMTAARGTISKEPRQVVLDHPHLETSARKLDSERATVFLRRDNTLDRILAAGNVQVQSAGPQRGEAKADQFELIFAKNSEGLRTAVLSGSVVAEVSGAQTMHANAGRVTLAFSGKSLLTSVQAAENVKLVQRQTSSNPAASAQDFELTAPIVDFVLSKNSHLQRVETTGAAQIALRPVRASDGQTLVTAGKFKAQFDPSGKFTSLHGAPDAHIVSQMPGQPDRVSTSQTVEAAIRPGGGIETIVQQGSVAYNDGQRKASGDRAQYTPGDQVLLLTGSPRVTEGGMTTSASSMRLNRATGEALAEGGVKSTYSDLRPQPDGALLASSSPIHVTARSMTVHGSAAIALYSGDVRLWQDANLVQASTIEFDRNRRAMIARGSSAQPVSTVLVQIDKSGNAVPFAITSASLTYTDSERAVHFGENVVAKGANAVIAAKQIDAFLRARGEVSPGQRVTPDSRLDRIVASGQVVITQSSRRAKGEQLVYTAADDKFVLSGGFPSIFDAERGKITGVSLTFFRHDDRVLVEGNSSSPAVTQTRVAR